MSARTSLTVSMLGEMQVSRGGVPVALPPSRKTRALFAYLILTGRSHRRERIASLFWDVADDRRGALRWSLSKIRALVDEPAAARLVADRESVEIVRDGLDVDLLVLRNTMAARSVADIPTETLETLAALHRGEPLEGLDLADFDEYQAWCIAERERARSLRISVLREIVTRLRHEPERATQYARAWTVADPLDESARATLVRLFGALGRREEARQVYESGRRIEQELGRHGGGELGDAWKSVAAGAARISQPRQSAIALASGEIPLVGREHELGVFGDLASEVRRKGSASVLVIMGESGVGKTRLITALKGSGQANVLSSACFESEGGHPYAPWLDAVRGASAGDAALALVTSMGASSEVTDPRDRERFFGAVATTVREAAATAPPAAVVFDDAQWMDQGSAVLLQHVVRANADVPLLAVLSARSGELEDNGALLGVLRAFRREGIVHELVVAPLGPRETETLVRAVRSDADAERVHAHTAGNPLFSIELARAGDTGATSPTLSALVRDRVAQLPAEAADVLRWGAILGDGFDAHRIDSLSALDLDTIVGALEALERRALLVRDSRPTEHGGTLFSFAHDVVRRAVYADLSEPRRRLMHRRVAEQLSSTTGAHAADVAHHAVLAHDAALAADACLAAARRSLRLFANADAHALARRGIRHAENLEDPQRTRRLIELHEVALAARRPDDVAETAARIEELSELALDLGALEHARLGFHLLGYMSWATGDWADAKRHILQAEAASRGASERERVLGMAEAARCLVMIERDLPHAHALVLEAGARAEKAGLAPSALHDARGMLAMHRGHVDEAAAEFELARNLAHVNRERQDEFQAIEHQVVLELRRNDFASALRSAEELARLGEKFREGSEAPFARALLALARVASGDESAHEALDAEVRALTVADAKHRLAFVLTRAAFLDVERGTLDRSCRRAEAALAAAVALGRPTEITFARYVLLLCAVRRGDSAAVTRRTEDLAAQPLTAVAADVRGLVEAELGRGGIGREGE